MNLARTLWIGAWLLALVLLHYTVRPVLAWRVQVDFLVIALLLISVRARPAIAAFVGFTLGVMTDSLTPGAFGAGALAMALVGFTSSWMKAVFFTENLLLNAVFVFAGKWAFDLVYLLAERRFGGTDLLVQLVWWSPLAALVTAAVGVGVLVVSRPAGTVHRR